MTLRGRWRSLLPSALLGALLSLAVAFPWLNGGRLLLLDWVIGPHTPIIAPSIYGLQGGLIAGLPFGLGVQLLNWALGPVASLVPVLVFFPIAAVGVASLIERRTAVRLTASLLYGVNPFVYDRIYVGQFGLLIGYALLPFAVKSLLRAVKGERRAWISLGLWWWLLIGMSPHFVWIFGVLVAMAAIVSRARWAVIRQLALGAVAAAVGTSYVLLAGAAGGTGVRVGPRNLIAYRTSADPHLGLFVNIIGLYGFWRKGPGLAKEIVTGWPVLLVGILLVGTLGAYTELRSRQSKPRGEELALVRIVGLAGIAGLLLALGDQGPLGSVYRFLYDRVPFFAIMREPEKFSILWALALAVCFALGIDTLVSRTHSRTGVLTTILLGAVLPLAYEPVMFDGLAGQLRTSQIPPAMASVDRILSHGGGRALVVPWHLYLAFPYTSRRVIANPGQAFLGSEVIQGDNVQLPGLPTDSISRRSAFLTYLFREGAIVRHFGEIVAPLGIHYVVLFKTVDWRSYAWLNSQSDLRKVYSSRSVLVYKNLGYLGLATQAASAQVLPNWGSILSLAQLNRLTSGPLLAVHAAPGPIIPPPAVSGPKEGHRLEVTPRFSFQVDFRVAKPSWLQFSRAFESGWILDKAPATELAEGNLGGIVAAGSGKMVFRPAYLVVRGEIVSTLIVLLLAMARLKRTRRRA